MCKFKTISFFIALVFMGMASCELVNLEQLACATFPDASDAVLGAAAPVWIEFSLLLEKTGAERLFKVLSPAGNVTGDLSWHNQRLVFTPRAEWEPGVRYVLSFSGEVETDDGRRFTLARTVPFFSVTAALPARLLSSDPPAGGMTGGIASIFFTFTRSMDTAASVNDFFRLSPDTEFFPEWTDNGTRLVIRPLSRWSPLALYTWTISTDLRDSAGIALTREYEGSFLVQNPAAPAPVIAGLRPAVNSAVTGFPPAGEALASGERREAWIGWRDAIRIEFTIPDRPAADDPARIDFASLQAAFRLSPSVPGSLHCVKTDDGRDECFVFAPDPGQRFLMNTLYRLTIARDLTNAEGAAMKGDFEAWFTPDIPEIAVESIVISNADFPDVNLPVPPGLFNSYIELDASMLAGYSPDYYAIRFNDGFRIAAEDVYALADKIELTRVFPETGGPYEKRNASFSAGSPPGLTVAFWGVPSAYGTILRLAVKGGPDGVVDARGSYLPHDVFIYFILREAAP